MNFSAPGRPDGSRLTLSPEVCRLSRSPAAPAASGAKPRYSATAPAQERERPSSVQCRLYTPFDSVNTRGSAVGRHSPDAEMTQRSRPRSRSGGR